MHVSRASFSALLITLWGAAGCGGRNEPAGLPKPADPVIDKSSKDPATKAPPRIETPSPSAQPKVETPPEKVGNAGLRETVGKLARKEGGKWQIDKEAQEKLEKLGPQVVDELLPLMADASTDVRRGAAYQLLPLAASRDDLAQAYAGLLDDSDATIRGIALSAVRQLKTAQKAAAAPAIAKLLARTSDDEQQRATAARLLGDVGKEAASLLPQLSSAAATDASSKVRSSALLAISQIAEPSAAVEVFVKALSDQDQSVRLVAVQRLRALGREAAPAVDELAKLLDNTDERTRRAAGEALVGLGSQSVPVFTAALDSSSRDAREIAVLALGKMGALAKPALPALKKRLSDSDPKVKALAKQSILEIESR